jgi:hypothetical protein
MPIELRMWWSILMAVAAMNLAACACLGMSLWRQRPLMGEQDFRLRKWMFLLGAGYAAGCAYRSVFPVFDIPRMSLADSALASAFIGRSVATIAELCFVAHWALVLHALARAGRAYPGANARTAVRCAPLLLPIIAVAECFSWHSVLTQVNFGHVVEESLWGMAALLVMVSLWSARHVFWPERTALFWAALVLTAGYAFYMFAVDVPRYFARWMQDLDAGREFAGLVSGAIDAAVTRNISHDWTVWRGEALWMGAYFSIGVWVSLVLAACPWANACSLQTDDAARRALSNRSLQAA